MADHHEAMDCVDCEAFLQLGIDAYDWLVRADLLIRKAASRGEVEYDDTVEQAFESMARAWLAPCGSAEGWVNRVLERGHSLNNLERFRQCQASIESMVAFLDNDAMTDSMRTLRDQAISEHGRGETAEFI